MTKNLIIYHANCADGFTAAWIARKALMEKGEMEIEIYAATYQNPPPDCAGKQVFIVDFSFPLDMMRDICELSGNVTMIDHHKSAQETFQTLEAEYPDCFTGLFDLQRSGALLTWDWFYPNVTAPIFVQVISDRDLWNFHLPYTRNVMAVIFSYEYSWERWDSLCSLCENDHSRLQLDRAGEAIERKHHKDIQELVQALSFVGRIGKEQEKIRLCNLPYTLTSDAGHWMCSKYASPYAACFWYTPEGWVFSLRATQPSVDVSEIAKRYGGGGHRSAAGFRLPLGTRIEEFIERIAIQEEYFSL